MNKNLKYSAALALALSTTSAIAVTPLVTISDTYCADSGCLKITTATQAQIDLMQEFAVAKWTAVVCGFSVDPAAIDESFEREGITISDTMEGGRLSEDFDAITEVVLKDQSSLVARMG